MVLKCRGVRWFPCGSLPCDSASFCSVEGVATNVITDGNRPRATRAHGLRCVLGVAVTRPLRRPKEKHQHYVHARWHLGALALWQMMTPQGHEGRFLVFRWADGFAVNQLRLMNHRIFRGTIDVRHVKCHSPFALSDVPLHIMSHQHLRSCAQPASSNHGVSECA